MKLTSPDFQDNEKIPIRFTGDGENINPNLIIDEIPNNCKSLVLIVDDPDAHRVVGYTWIHWVVFNILVKNRKLIIKENSLPGTYGESTYKRAKYGGPNPQKGSGIHHYHFKVYAINKLLNLKEGAKLEDIEREINSHVLDKIELIGLYFR